MISRRLLAALFSLALLFPAVRAASAARTAYVIIDAQTGFVLEQADARDKRQVGSLTKVATAMVNPHGIDPCQRSMPFSPSSVLARLSRYAMNKTAFRFYVSQQERQISFEPVQQKKAYILRNTNELLGANGADGVTTGKTAR